MHPQKLNVWLVSSALGYVLLSTGCAPVAFMGAATGITTCASEERSLKTVWTDARIKSAILVEWSRYKNDLAHQIDVVVHHGQVLLTGTADDPQMQIDAIRLVWKVPGVQEVINETTIGQEGNFGQFAQDSWISTQLKSNIFVDNDIRSLNYNIQTVDGIVYLMGIAQTKQELDQVVHYARHISGVKKVVSHVVIKGQDKSPTPLKTRAQFSQVQSKRPHRVQPTRMTSSYSSKRENDAFSIESPQSSNDNFVEMDNQLLIVQDDPINTDSLDAPNNASAFQ